MCHCRARWNRVSGMFSYASGATVIALVTFYAAWRENADENRRDAALPAIFGGGVLFAAGWLA